MSSYIGYELPNNPITFYIDSCKTFPDFIRMNDFCQHGARAICIQWPVHNCFHTTGDLLPKKFSPLRHLTSNCTNS